MNSTEEWKQFIEKIDVLDLNEKKQTKEYHRLISQMEHCIGLDNAKPYKRNGCLFYKPYRNYYDTVDCMWDALAEMGYAFKNRMYHLTLMGIGWLSFQSDIFIYSDYSGEPVDVYREVFRFFCKMDVSCCYGCWFPTSARACAAHLRLPIQEVRSAIGKMVEQGYIAKGHFGGCGEEGPYCVHGYYCTQKARETDTWEAANKKEAEYINKVLLGNEVDE